MSWSFTFQIRAYYSHIASQFMNFPLFVNLALHFIEYMHLLCFWSAQTIWFAHWTSKVVDFSIIFDFGSLTLVDYFILTARLWLFWEHPIFFPHIQSLFGVSNTMLIFVAISSQFIKCYFGKCCFAIQVIVFSPPIRFCTS